MPSQLICAKDQRFYADLLEEQMVGIPLDLAACGVAKGLARSFYQRLWDRENQTLGGAIIRSSQG